jgi:hypothetical protein
MPVDRGKVRAPASGNQSPFALAASLVVHRVPSTSVEGLARSLLPHNRTGGRRRRGTAEINRARPKARTPKYRRNVAEAATLTMMFYGAQVST